MCNIKSLNYWDQSEFWFLNEGFKIIVRTLSFGFVLKY